jgi:hypothetical protein
MVNNDRFPYCCGCNEVHRITPFDEAPIYDLQGSHVREIPMNDRHRFMERHSGHAIEELSRVAEDWLEPDNAADPMAETYLLVANERYHFLLQRSRRSIAEPVVYRVLTRSPLAFGLRSIGSESMEALPARPLAARQSPAAPQFSQRRARLADAFPRQIAADRDEKIGAAAGLRQSVDGRRAIPTTK